MSNNHEVVCTLDLKYKQTQVCSSFAYGNAVIKFDNKDDLSKLNLCISGKRNIGLDKLKDIFFRIWEMLYFFNGFFPVLLNISFDGEEDKFFPKRIARQWCTTKSFSLIRSNNRLCFISQETLNCSTLKNYASLKAVLKYPLSSIFAVQSYDNIYGEHRFVLASHAAEGIIEEKYDSQRSNHNFQGRMEFLFEPLLNANRKYKTKLFSSIGLSQNTYFKLLKDTRHFYSHLAKERKRFIDGKEFVSDYWILSLAIRMFIMQEIGVNYEASLYKANATAIAEWIAEYR